MPAVRVSAGQEILRCSPHLLVVLLEQSCGFCHVAEERLVRLATRVHGLLDMRRQFSAT